MLKTIVWDIETSTIWLRAWSLRQKFFSPDNIIKNPEIIVACWKELGKRKVHTLSQRWLDEYELIRQLREALDDADVLVHQNGDRFDLKRLTAKLIEYQLPPLNKLQTVDTLKESRRVAAFPSHKLDYMGGLLVGSKKIDTNFQLWIDCEEGSEVAYKKMERYCRHDVKLTEDYYLKLRPYMTRHPNMADSNTANCPFCNARDSGRFNKVYRTKVGIERYHYKCVCCGAPFTNSGHKYVVGKPISRV